MKTRWRNGRIQFHMDCILAVLKTTYTDLIRADPKTFCVMGAALLDIYEDESDLLQMGVANMNLHVGVLNFTRYDPRWRYSTTDWSHWELKEHAIPRWDLILLERSIRTLVHELMHLFLMEHCHYYHCIMQGSGHLDEDISIPMHLCPICLQKLGTRLWLDDTKFSYQRRYESILATSEKLGLFLPYQEWLRSRLVVRTGISK